MISYNLNLSLICLKLKPWLKVCIIYLRDWDSFVFLFSTSYYWLENHSATQVIIPPVHNINVLVPLGTCKQFTSATICAFIYLYMQLLQVPWMDFYLIPMRRGRRWLKPTQKRKIMEMEISLHLRRPNEKMTSHRYFSYYMTLLLFTWLAIFWSIMSNN